MYEKSYISKDMLQSRLISYNITISAVSGAHVLPIYAQFGCYLYKTPWSLPRGWLRMQPAYNEYLCVVILVNHKDCWCHTLVNIHHICPQSIYITCPTEKIAFFTHRWGSPAAPECPLVAQSCVVRGRWRRDRGYTEWSPYGMSSKTV